jgi:predicted ribosomally synthesized peptide with SipW-like signal peptide
MRLYRSFRERSRSARPRLLVIAAALLLLVAAGTGTWAAFTAWSSNTSNSIASGTVAIEDNDSNSATFSLSGLEPGDTDQGCVKVTYRGSLASTVRLYGSTTGSGLDAYLSLKVTRGSYSSEPAFDSCSNFAPDSTQYVSGQANGVIYVGTLQGFPGSYAAGLVDPETGAPEAWTTNEAHVYKLEITVGDNVAAEGKGATQEFVFEARNS